MGQSLKHFYVADLVSSDPQLILMLFPEAPVCLSERLTRRHYFRSVRFGQHAKFAMVVG